MYDNLREDQQEWYPRIDGSISGHDSNNDDQDDDNDPPDNGLTPDNKRPPLDKILFDTDSEIDFNEYTKETKKNKTPKNDQLLLQNLPHPPPTETTDENNSTVSSRKSQRKALKAKIKTALKGIQKIIIPNKLSPQKQIKSDTEVNSPQKDRIVTNSSDTDSSSDSVKAHVNKSRNDDFKVDKVVSEKAVNPKTNDTNTDDPAADDSPKDTLTDNNPGPARRGLRNQPKINYSVLAKTGNKITK